MDNTDKLLDGLFQKARTAKPKTSFETIQKEFLTNTSIGLKAKLLTLKNGLIMLAAITTIGISMIYLINPIPKDKEVINKVQMVQNLSTIADYEEQVKIYDSIKKVQRKDSKEVIALLNNNGDKINNLENHYPKIERIKLEENNYQQKNEPEEPFLFPVLSEEEIKEHYKQKDKMIKQLLKFDKKKYAFIPTGKLNLIEKSVNIQSFYMQATEVSVLEYRTFIYDLILQKNKEDFLKAKPDQKQWTKTENGKSINFLEPMEENYFVHPAYNDYPINNISREGAMLYCKWLTEEVNKSPKNRNSLNKVRIPTTDEWIYAALGGKKENTPYPWGGPYIRNSKGCFLANFYPEKDNYSADGAFLTSKVDSYNPNEFGLYCISGNIAEMTINEDGTPVCKGGSWKSIGADIQITAKNLFEGVTTPNVEIGFRPVITFLDETKPLIGVMGKSTSEIPPGTTQISNELYYDKTEVSNFSWKEYVYWQAKTYGKTSKEYKEALPDTTVWNELNKAYTTHYYSHPAYNNYPVIGISYEQAVAFCKWRTERVKQLYKINNEIGNDFEYRLPTQAEWENIAKAGYSSINAKKDGDKHKFNLKRSKEDFEGGVAAGKLNYSADVTAPTTSYWPNNYGIYNIIGNVAEMVEEKGIAKGGSWKHTAEEATLENKLTYNKPTCWVGFRCVCELKR